MSRYPRGLVALSLTALAIVPAAPTEAAACGRAAAERRRTWFTATPKLPRHTYGYEALHGDVRFVRAVAVDPVVPRIVFVTDGSVILRSDDGGCTWQTVWSMPVVVDGDTAEISSLDVAHIVDKKGHRTQVVGAVNDLGDMGTTFGTRFVRSSDGRKFDFMTDVYGVGRGWDPVVRSAGTITYAAVPSPVGGTAYLRSDDGFASWTQTSPVADTHAPRWLTSFAVNPRNPSELWDWAGRDTVDGETLTGLRRSLDGGATWTQVDPWPMYDSNKPGWSTLDVAWPRKGGPARLFVVGSGVDPHGAEVPVASWSGDGGKSWQQIVPTTVTVPLIDAVVTHLPNGDLVVVSSYRLAYRVPYRGRAPRADEWLPLPKTPERIVGLTYRIGRDPARASATLPGVIAVPSDDAVWLLAVAR